MYGPLPKYQRVGVGVCTRNSPHLLKATLVSLAALRTNAFKLVFIIVENNDRKTCATLVRAFSEAVAPARVVYEIEPAIGTASARNKVLEIALADRLDGLALIEDGEAADPGWVVALVMASQSRALHLVGGPVRFAPPRTDATQVEAMMWRGVDARFRAVEAEVVQRTAKKTDGSLPVRASNWFADLDFIANTGVRFETDRGVPGSEDGAFFKAMKAAGAKTGWVPKAIVYEDWPRERLTFAYQYAYGREDARKQFRLRFPQFSMRALAAGLGAILSRYGAALFFLIRAPFDNGVSSVRALRALGAAAGIFGALSGRRPS